MDSSGPQVVASDAPEVVTKATEQPATLGTGDSEKQVIPSIPLSDPSNAPMLVEEEKQDLHPEPGRESNKEVMSSWQTKSKEESAPIPMDFHESRRPQDNLMNDVKGAPPAYNSLTPATARTPSDDLLTSPSPIEPDGGSMSAPKAEDRSAVGQLLSWITPAPTTATLRPPALSQPVVIPQLDVPPQGESVPFARCYSDALAAHSVSMREFIAFLDGLAVAQAPNSALQGLKMFGAGASFVPIPLIPLAGRGIKALASSGSGHSGSRARLYIERAKKEYFAPRGLRLSIVRDNDLNTLLQIPLHAHRLAPLTKSNLTNSLCERRMEGVSPYVAPLRYNVPEDEQIQGVHKLARKELNRRLKKDARDLSDLRERQWKEVSYTGFRQQEWEDRYGAKMVDLRRAQMILAQNRGGGEAEAKEALDALQQDQRDLQHLVSERQVALQNLSARGRAVEAEMEEEQWSRRLKWIVIEPSQ